MTRAIWSAPPPVPAGTMNSTGRVGSHAAVAAVALSKTAAPAAAANVAAKCEKTPGRFMVLFPQEPFLAAPPDVSGF
jgi:hypothetical protein